MNSNKTRPPAKKPGLELTGSKKDTAARPVTPTPGKANGSGYTPKYQAPTEPVVPRAPNAEIRLDVPHSMDIVTMEDLVRRIKGVTIDGVGGCYAFKCIAILARSTFITPGDMSAIIPKKALESMLITAVADSASILSPGIPLKVTTALTPSGMLYYALVVTPKNAERETSRWRVEDKGPPVPTDKLGEALGRRRALEALLEQLERKVGKELLG